MKKIAFLLLLLVACAAKPVIVEEPTVQKPVPLPPTTAQISAQMAGLTKELLNHLGDENIRLNHAVEDVKITEEFYGYLPSLKKFLCPNNAVFVRKERAVSLINILESLLQKYPQNPEFALTNCVVNKQAKPYMAIFELEEQMCLQQGNELSEWEQQVMGDTIPKIVNSVYGVCAEYKK